MNSKDIPLRQPKLEPHVLYAQQMIASWPKWKRDIYERLVQLTI